MANKKAILVHGQERRRVILKISNQGCPENCRGADQAARRLLAVSGSFRGRHRRSWLVSGVFTDDVDHPNPFAQKLGFDGRNRR